MGLDSLQMYRWAKACDRLRVPLVPKLLQRLMLHLFTSFVPVGAEIGEGTTLGYCGAGIFVHPTARLGKHCVVAPFVSIAGRGDVKGTAQIGDYVRLGPGSKILGPVRIGDFAQVGPNAVVVKDVPPGAVVFGVPARVVRYMNDPADEYERSTGRSVAPQDRERALRFARPVAASSAPAGADAAPL